MNDILFCIQHFWRDCVVALCADGECFSKFQSVR